MRLRKSLVEVLLLLLVFSVSSGAQPSVAGRFVPGQILVKFRPGAAATAVADAHRVAGGLPALEIARTGVHLVRVPAGREAAAIALYTRNPNVVYAEPNYIRTIPALDSNASVAVPGDAYFNEEWGLNNTGQSFYCVPWFSSSLCFYSGTPDADIDAPEAWAISTGTSNVTVAVIDTGVDYTHPDLAPNYAGGYDYVFNDADPMDDHGHGTHVAGTIAAAMQNLTGSPGQAEGVVGVAPNARIRAYKVCRSDGTCDDFAIQQAIARAISDKANVINMSLGDPSYSQSLDNAVQDAWNAGLVIVAAAGNSGTTDPLYPAAFDNVISVAAFDEDHQRASFSNYGDWVDISAPGNTIMSTYPMTMCGASTVPGQTGCYTWLSGTSMATPHVAGAAALVWSRSDVRRNSQVVDILLSSADPKGTSNQRLDTWTVHGGLNLYNAMTYISTKPVADAGPDQSVIDDDHDGAALVTLNGTGSNDPNGSILSYNWTEGGAPVGGEATSDVSLSVGIHKLILEVTDNDGETATDTVVVTVYASAPVSITATTPIAAETGPAAGLVTVVRGGSTSDALTVHYVATGTATAASDYVELPGSVTIDAGSSSATVAVTPIDDAVYEADESVILTLTADAAYSLGWPGEATITIVSDDLPSDLIVTAASAPATAGADSDIVVTESTKNQGGGSAMPSHTGFYLSANTILDASDVLLGSRPVPMLASGAADSTSTPVHIPGSTLTGQYYVLAKADWDSGVEESTETNNVRATGMIKIGPDLAVTALTTPSNASAGSTILVSDTTANQGGGSAPASATQYFLSSNASLDSADVLVGSRVVSMLPAGAKEAVSASVMIPSTTGAGIYYVIAKADGGAAVKETNELNNAKVSSQVKIGADLVITALAVPSKAGAGDAVIITDTTTNQGAADADASSTGFYLSSNLTLDSTDVLLGSRAVPAITAGASNSSSTSLQIPLNTAGGTYYIIANTDVEKAVAESIETNNTKFSTVLVGPDLVVTSVAAPSSATPGAAIVISDTTANQGAGSAAASMTQYYLSANSVFDSTDLPLGSRAIAPLASAGTASGSVTVSIPATISTGVYYVIAESDGGNVVAETSETNNSRPSSQVKIGADLIVSVLAVPALTGAGVSVTVTDTTTNQGTGTADASITSFYLSVNATLDASDVQLGNRSVSALAAGASSSGSSSFQIPTSTATGSYYVIAVADATSAVGETVETNNTKIALVRIGPDLVVTAASAPSSAVAGSTITESDTIANQGGGSAAPSETRYYLSVNGTVDSSDVLIGSRQIGDIAAAASSSGSTALTIPAGTTAGAYYLLVSADGPHSVSETGETNNTRAVSIKITQP